MGSMFSPPMNVLRYAFIVPLFCVALTACSGEPQDAVAVPAVGDQPRVEYTVPTGENKYRDLEHGKEVWFAIGALGGVNGVNANGVAQAHGFEDGAYRLTIQLNVERAPEGIFYEGWLLRDGAEPLSTGHLRSRFGDVRHALQFDTDADLREFLQVAVMRESDDGNPAPGERIAEGVLRPQERGTGQQ